MHPEKQKNHLKSIRWFWCRRWESNPHGFPDDFESSASAIPPRRLVVLTTLLYYHNSICKIKKKSLFFSIKIMYNLMYHNIRRIF